MDGGVDEDVGRAHHARLDSKTFDGEDRTAEEIATDLKHRYGGRNAVRYSGDMNEIPQRLLMPSVHDASLWQVKVKVWPNLGICNIALIWLLAWS